MHSQEVELFKAYLRINTMHPNPNLAPCVSWLSAQAKELGMTCTTFSTKPHLPVLIMTRVGADPSLPSIILNSHMDVVPVIAEKWTALPPFETPFSAWEDAQGRIYARGAQDMKCVGAQYLCALKRLLGKALLRTIHVTWMPDEEIGGDDGMAPFTRSAAFRALRPGLLLDEGLAHADNKFVVYHGERTGLWTRFTAEGPVGHGSKMLQDTAMERMSRVIVHLSRMRDECKKKMEENPSLGPGDVTSVNITAVQSGTSTDGGKTFSTNVIPAKAMLLADIRAIPSDCKHVVSSMQKLAKENKLGLEWEGGHSVTDPPSAVTPLEPWWPLLQESLTKWGAPVETAIFPACTDARYVRAAGVAAFGFSPMRGTPSLLHDHNEYLERSKFLEGVDVYTHLITTLANAPQSRLMRRRAAKL